MTNTNDTPPTLMAEDLAKNIIGEWGYEEPYWWKPIAECLESYAKTYAARKTAAKDERIKELEEALSAWQSQSVKEVSTLQAKLDDANGQVAMVVEALYNSIGMITSEYCSHDLECGANNEACYAQEYYKALTLTQPTAEQWLADKLKPWREGVSSVKTILKDLKEDADSDWGACHLVSKLEKALEATEGLV